MAIPAGTTLGPYEVQGPLGAGGMGEVYRARDSRLLRDVALKIVPPGLAQNPDALARFEREAQIVAALSHPNIVAIFDVGREGGIHYLVMELVEGETLRDRLDTGRLLPRTAVDLALQAARGLAAAHAKGVVHRDLKPDNLLVTRDNFVKILDFGLARQGAADSGALARPDSPTLTRHTEPGTLLGTVGYMSPEQARGQTADARSDIFSLGAILCEMLTGERAFSAGSRAEALSAILRDEPMGIGRLVREASPALSRLVGRCLEKSPEERFQSAGDLLFALDALAAPSSGSGSEALRDGTAAPSIAVLPFSNMSPDPDTEYFSDGMSEEIINALTQLPGLRVAARTSSFAFKGKNQDLRDIAEQLGVTTVLEGSVRRAGNRLRITAQLIDARGGKNIWSERYDREVVDVFAIQDEIAAAIAGRLRLTLAASEGRRAETRDPEAYDLYLKGRHFFNRRAAPEAIARFEEAIARDPDFSPAYTGLSDSYGIHAYYGGIDTRVAYARARAAMERARELTPESAEVNLSMGIIEHYFGWDFEKEERELSEAARRNPRSAAPLYWLSLLHGLRGGLDEALAFGREAAHLDPLSPFTVNVVAWALFVAGRFEDARATFRKALEIAPEAVLPLGGFSRCESALGNGGAAITAGEKLVAVMNSTWTLGILAEAYASAGREGEAHQILAALDQRGLKEYVAPEHVIRPLLRLGDKDAAFKAAERACLERNALAWWGVLHDPTCEALRQDPRYPALVTFIRARGDD